MIKVSTLKKNPNNPREIKDEKFELLKRSITEFPEMMKLRPMVIDNDNVVLGGNMRLAALKALGMKEIPDDWVMRADELTDEQKREFVIKDNNSFGQYDWDLLSAWDDLPLKDWGLDVPNEKIDLLEDGEEIEIEQSVQLEPPREYILIMCEPNSEEWEELKESLQLQMVKRGGYADASAFNSVGLERVLTWGNFKERFVNSNSK